MARRSFTADQPGGRVHARHLAGCVDSPVGPPGAEDPHGPVEEAGDDGLDFPLYRPLLGLDLPPVEAPPVVLDGAAEAAVVGSGPCGVHRLRKLDRTGGKSSRAAVDTPCRLRVASGRIPRPEC